MARVKRVVLGLCLLAAVGFVLLLFLPLPGREMPSPDGAFVAVVQTRVIDGLVPVMPGQGSDKPGLMTVYRRDGRSCGTAVLEMLSFAYDLVWDLNARPRTARIGPVATWNLDACTVDAS